MKWTPGGTSEDIEDRRDESGGGGGGGGFGGGGFGGIHLGIGGTIIVAVLSLVFHENLFNVISGGGGSPAAVSSAPNPERTAAEKPQVELVSFVLDDVQKTWARILPEQTQTRYQKAKLVLFRDAYPSGCGTAQTAIGPFYCPEDQKVYLDLSFLQELTTKFKAPGEFAQAYVIAHELGHHVQKLLGTEGEMRRLQEENPQRKNALSVRLELQADCYAGVWAHSTEQRDMTENKDIQAAMNAAASVGDDRLQKAARGSVNPETFTHGSSADRMKWFQRGEQSGTISNCDTFGR